MADADSENGSNTSSSPTSDGSEGPTQMQIEMDQQTQLWNLESELRLKTGTFTSKELRCLQVLSLPMSQTLNEQPRNLILADLRSSRLIEESHITYSPGQMVSIQSEIFSLLKARLIANRLGAFPTGSNCYCLPKASFMPAGCAHRDGHAFAACTNCRTCVRCDKFCKALGFKKEQSCTCHPAGLDMPANFKH